MGSVDLNAVANTLRNGSSIWMNAKYEYDQITERKYQEMPIKARETSPLLHVLENTTVYLQDRIRGGLDALRGDEFIIDYDARGNLDGSGRFGVECVGLSFKIEWKLNDVVVDYYNAVPRQVVIPGELKSMIDDGRIRNLKKMTEVTGLDQQALSDQHPEYAAKLLAMFSACTTGQNKIARLVKLCLLYLDHLETGVRQYDRPQIATIRYCVSTLVQQYDARGTSYVYTTNDDAHHSNTVLYAMCQEYPNPLLGGKAHIKIPADSHNTVLVGYNPDGCARRVNIGPETIWSTAVLYCNQFKLGKDLESAMAIACTLHQNRYLSKVSLPRVVSGVDLVYPALAKMLDGVTDKSWLNLDAAKVLGRTHQMLCLVLFKDVYVSAYNTSTIKRNVTRSIRSLASRESHALLEYIEDKSVTDVLKITKDMVWISKLDDEAIVRLGSYSVFEGFWLINYPKEVLQDGVIKSLKKGMRNPIEFDKVGVSIDSYRVLSKEVQLAGGPDDFNMPDGAYNVRLSVIRSISKRARSIKFKGRSRNRDVGYSADETQGAGLGGGRLPCSKVPPSSHGYKVGWELNSDGEASDESDEEDGDERDSGDDFVTVDLYDMNDVIRRSKNGGGKFTRKQGARGGPTQSGGEDLGSPKIRPRTPPDASEEEIFLEGEVNGTQESEENKPKYSVPIPKTLSDDKGMYRIHDPTVPIGDDEVLVARKVYDKESVRLVAEEKARKQHEEIQRKKKEEENRKAEEERRRQAEEVRRKEAEERAAARRAEEEARAEAARQKLEKERKVKADEAARLAEARRKLDEENRRREEAENKATEEARMSAELAEVQRKKDAEVADMINKERERYILEVEHGRLLAEEERRREAEARERAKETNIPVETTPTQPKNVPRHEWYESEGDSTPQPTPVNTDMGHLSLLEVEKMKVKDFVLMKCVYSPVVENFRDYVSCVPMKMVEKGTVQDFRKLKSWKSVLLQHVEYIFEHDEIELREYPEEYRELIWEVREAIARREEKMKISLPSEEDVAEMNDGLRKTVMLGLLEKDTMWHPGDKEDEILADVSALAGIWKYLVMNNWWVNACSRFFVVDGGTRKPKTSEVRFLCKFIDDCGDVKEFGRLWKAINHDPLFMSLDWSPLRGRIESTFGKMSAQVKKMSVKVAPGTVFIDRFSLSDSVGNTEKGGLKRDAYNHVVEQVAAMAVGKRFKLLCQLYLSGIMLMHPAYYVLAYRSIRINDRDMDATVRRLLGEWLNM